MAVLREPVSGIISLISGKNTGKFAESGAVSAMSAQDVAQTQRSTGQFPTRVNREIGADNRESWGGIKEKTSQVADTAGGNNTSIQHPDPLPKR